jgi:hypothetical protein
MEWGAKGLRTMKQRPAAFMSYAHIDDEDGRLTEFRKLLSREVQIQTGEQFPIFQDRDDIEWGRHWKERIEESLNEVTFLIPIITPSFFKSKACRDELQRFIEREKKLGRNDLILPVYYVDCPLLNEEAKRITDELAQAIAARQWEDWRYLRHYSWDAQQVRWALEQLAVQIRDALERVQAPRTLVPRLTPSAARLPKILPNVKRVVGNDLGKGVRMGGQYQDHPQDLELVSSDWARWKNAGWVKSGWFYNPPDSDLSHAVAFFKIHCFDDGSGYVHVLSVSGSWHELWLRTNTGSSERHRFIYSDPKDIKSKPEAVDDSMVRWPFTWKEPSSS